MYKNTEANKNKLTIAITAILMILLFGSVFTLFGMSVARVRFVKKYTVEVGNVLGGNVLVYSEHGDELMLVRSGNVRSMAKMSTGGSIMWGQKSDDVTGNSIRITSVTKDDDHIHRYLLIEELSNGKTRITVTGGDYSRSAVLNDVTYSSYLGLIAEKGNNGDNKPVDEIP